MSTVDAVEMVALNVAGVVVITVPTYIELFPALQADTEFWLKVGVAISLIVANIYKAVESHSRSARNKRKSKEDEGDVEE